MSKPEWSNWRSLTLNKRHRQYGKQLYVTDMDFLELGPDGMPVAGIEAKHILDLVQLLSFLTDPRKNFSIRGQSAFCTRAGVPHLLIGHSEDCQQFRVIPCNDIARNLTYLPNMETLITETEWVRFLYALRGWKLSEALASKIAALEVEKHLQHCPSCNETWNPATLRYGIKIDGKWL